ncbi:MAG: class I SAM-dependent methyltransferase [Terriglobales bacterium]
MIAHSSATQTPSQRREWNDHSGALLDSVKGFDLIACEVCRFKHIVPIPSESELEAEYRHEYYRREKPLYLERTREDLEWWELVYGERYDTFEAMLPPSRRRILDIGSGPGFFLAHGKRRGWQTVGIEPSSQATAHSRALELEVHEEFLSQDTAARLGSFDVVHMSEVLEHIPDPQRFLQLVASMLGPGGVICVAVPNDYNPLQAALREACGYSPWWVAPPHHINYFDFESLADLLRHTGFSVVAREATFPIELFLLMGDNYVGNDSLGRQCHARRKRFELNLAAAGMTSLKRKLFQSLADLGIGREALLVGVRQ